MTYDHHRPVYHIHPNANWMNDPNGAIQWQGQYHLFYQYNPHGTFSANKHWAHVVSEDLLHWKELPIALTPTPGGYDKDGCFSGCMVVQDGHPTIVYTGVFPEVQCLATSSDDLLTWQKHPSNPVLVKPPAELDTITFRDPFVWRGDDGWWYMLLGSGLRGIGGTCLLYYSQDLRQWDYIHALLTGNLAETGKAWNCPSFFRLGERQVLIVSGQPVWKPFFWSGTYRDHQFTPQAHGLVDYGGCLYATQVFKDELDRTLLWGWMWESRPDEEITRAGWAGVMALPRLVDLNQDGSLALYPVPEVLALRGEHLSTPGRLLTALETPLDEIYGCSIEINARFQPGKAGTCGLNVLQAADGSEFTRIGYDTDRKEVFVDRAHAQIQPTMAFGWKNPAYHSAPLPLAEGEEFELRVFVDHSVIEVFTNHGIALSSRVYPLRPDSQAVSSFATGDSCRLVSCEAWDMSSIN